MFSDVEIGVFMDELEEKVQIINDNLLILEQETSNQEVLQEIFRAAHTIKGSSGIMGYEKMTKLTHEIESLFDKIRNGEITVNSEMINVFFEASDTLKLLKDEITDTSIEVDISDIIVKLTNYVQGAAGKVVKETPPPLTKGEPRSLEGVVQKEQAAASELASAGNMVDEAIDETLQSVIIEAELKGFLAYKIKVILDSGCQMKSVRAFLIFEMLQQAGEIVRSVPAAEELQAGNFDLNFEIVFLTQEDQDQIENILMSIAEVQTAEIQILSTTPAAVREDTATKSRVSDMPAADIEQQDIALENIVSPKQEAKSALPEAVKTVKTVKTVRVDVQKLDNLMNLVGELVIDRTRLNRFTEIFEDKYGSGELAESINEMSNHLGQVTGDLQEQIMKARMLPIAQVFNRFPRMVRDTAQKLAKEIDFVIEGKETELDRNVIETIGDPLIHLIRNSVDHGIETPQERLKKGKPSKGKLFLKAAYHESHIIITIEDDGKGIDADKMRQKAVQLGLYDQDSATRLSDREALDLIFRAGFSTKQAVSDLSGRGVGMDVVNKGVEQINGTLELSSKVDIGTKIVIRLPLTLAIIRALMVNLGRQIYSFPMANVQETLRIDSSEIRSIGNSEVIVVRDRIMPLLRLRAHFGINDFDNPVIDENEKLFVVVIASAEKQVAVVVDKLLGEQEIVIKSLGDYLGEVDGLSGATILGDGGVALIIDSRGLIKQTGATGGLLEGVVEEQYAS